MTLLATLFLAAPTLLAQGTRLGEYLATLDGLDEPRAAAIDARGRILVVERGADRVRVFEPDRTRSTTFGRSGSGPGELLRPSGVALGSQGRVVVADTGNHRLAVFDAEGAPLATFGHLGADPGELHTPLGVAADGGRIAVADSENGRVQTFDWGGNPLAVLGAGALARPVDVAFGEGGVLFVADADRHRIERFDADGRALGGFGDYGWSPGLFSTPMAVVQGAGALYVADGDNHRVQVFDADGTFLHKWGVHAIRPGEGEGKLHYPTHLALAPDGELAALVEPLDGRVQLFGPAEGENPEARLRLSAGQPSPHYGNDLHAFGDLMVIVEPETATVDVFDLQWSEPRLVSKVGSFGDGLGLLRRPMGVALGPPRSLLVCDAAGPTLQLVRLRGEPGDEVEFDPEMAVFVKQLDFARLGRALSDVELEWLVEPRAVARAPGGEILVLDGRNERVLVLDEHLVYRRSFGGHGEEPGRLRRPTALAFAPDGERVYVVDADNRRVQVLDPDGRPFGVLAGGPGLDDPFGIAVTADGHVWVSDAAADRLLVWDGAGRFVRALGRTGLGRLEFRDPRALAVDGQGRIVVLDHGNHRGQVLDAEGGWIGAFGSRLYTKPARLPETVDPAETAR